MPAHLMAHLRDASRLAARLGAELARVGDEYLVTFPQDTVAKAFLGALLANGSFFCSKPGPTRVLFSLKPAQ